MPKDDDERRRARSLECVTLLLRWLSVDGEDAERLIRLTLDLWCRPVGDPKDTPRPRRHWQRRVDVRDEAVRRAERIRGVCRG